VPLEWPQIALVDTRQVRWIGDGSGTLAAAGTRQTILFAKLDTNHPADRPILLERPLAAAFSLRADGLLGLPIDGKTAVIKALSRTALPTRTARDRTEQFHCIGVLTVHNMVSIHIAGIHRMFCWKQVLFGKCLVDGCSPLSNNKHPNT